MPTLEDGQIFERYQIIRWLGSGVAGESYEAEDRVLLRKVTLKLIHPWGTLPDSARRQFFRELQGISALNHPYLTAVLDYGEIDGRVYVARRYISSGSLLSSNGRLWYRPPLGIADAFTYAHQLAQVLHYIHQHGYVHGALSFGNVLVLRGPNAEHEAGYAPFLLADSCLASFVRRFGQPKIATLAVSAAPEQMGKRVTPASDQFALAVLVYFWLAGRPPYLGTPAEVEQLKLAERFPPLSTLNPNITTAQDDILARALTTFPEERYPSVLAFTEALLTSQSAFPQARTAPAGIFLEQPETPREILHAALDQPPATESAAVTTEAIREAEVADLSSPGPVAAVSLDEESPTSAFFALLHAPEEPEPANLEQLPRTGPGESLPVEESAASAGPAPVEASLPTIPETPRLELADLERLDLPVQEEPDTSATSAQTAEEDEEATAEQPTLESTSAPAVTSEEEAIDSSGASSAGEEKINVSNASSAKEEATDDTSNFAATEENGTGNTIEQSGETATSRAPRLIVSSPYTSSSYEFLLTSEEIRIGRAGSSDLHLEQDNLTSRHHALIKCTGESVLIFDKRSYNGVFLNGQRIEVERGYELADGDHIGIGNYELIFRAAPAGNISHVVTQTEQDDLSHPAPL